MEIALPVIANLILLIYIYKEDRVEREPSNLILKAFMLGILSVCIVLVIDIVMPSSWPGIDFDIYDNYICAGVVEESVKFFLLMMFIYKNKNFNYRFDGIVYACCVGLGFAIVEDILYVLDEYTMSMSMTRAIIAIPGHFSFAIFMGYYLSKAKESNNNILYLILALIVPVFIHGTYDYLPFGPWIIFVVIETLFAVNIIRKTANKDQQII